MVPAAVTPGARDPLPGPVDLRIEGACARLRLTAPERRNALDAATVEALHTALRTAERTPGCRAAVLSASGPVFCSGLDPAVVTADAAQWATVGDRMWELLTALATGPLVTAAVVTGRVTGGGVGLVSACDLVFAGHDASFRLTEALLGLVPATVLPFLTARMGERAAFRAALLAEEIDSTAAGELGLADTVGDLPEQDVRRLLLALRRAPRPGAVAELKRCRDLLRGTPEGYPGYARGLLADSLADPLVRARVAALREEGLLP
ncbi:enoyl-CoA hydratase/isomerase family protein [Streptomyces longwoodensis]|uniref:enoyl-CoA hydratase/isomerase family protein n=1 Tax=Streptomyces longwoodensis TaxID=68231 RepID=UPI0033D70522